MEVKDFLEHCKILKRYHALNCNSEGIDNIEDLERRIKKWPDEAVRATEIDRLNACFRVAMRRLVMRQMSKVSFVNSYLVTRESMIADDYKEGHDERKNDTH